MNEIDIQSYVGNTDLYLLDQVLKGRIDKTQKVLDLGCGEGRNLKLFLKNGNDVWGIDKNPLALQMLRIDARALGLRNSQIAEGDVAKLPFENEQFDFAISSAVFHFASNLTAFRSMWKEAIRVLRPGGYLFARLASTIGLPVDAYEESNGLCYQPNQGFSMLLRPEDLLWVRKQGLKEVDPFKTVVVERKRSMAVLMLQKTS